MSRLAVFSGLLSLFCLSTISGQRITTIQLDGVQYFVSRMNPYSPELNYFLAYQYCRSLGLQLASFETREKADSITQYLSNAGYNKYDFWTSGNKLGTNMFLWMSTGLPFNATFNYMKKSKDAVDDPLDIPSGSTSPQRTARESDSGSSNGCVALKAPDFEWDTDDCMKIKDFICEQTRCYYYNYGSIPVSSAQGKPVYSTTTTPKPAALASSPSPVHHHQPPHNSDQDKFHVGITDFINKLRSNQIKAAGAAETHVKEPGPMLTEIVAAARAAHVDREQSTNGPYDSFPSVELQDDPSAHIGGGDPQHSAPAVATRDEDYVSTIEPETVTIYERSFIRPLI